MQRERAARWLPWIGVILIATVAIQPLMTAPPYGDDIRLHFFRIPVIQAFWQAGVPYARWIPYLNFGYGSPLFNFYPPLSAYGLAAVYFLVGQNALIAINAMFALAILTGTVGMFLLGRHLYGIGGGLLAAAAYGWSPHFLYQIYARGSSANALAMAFFPPAILAFILVAQRPSAKRISLAALLLALIMLSHLAAGLLFAGPLIVVGITSVWFSRTSGQTPWNRIRAVIIALLLGLGLSAFSWLPALTEIQYTRYAAEVDKVDFQDYFADVWRWPEKTISELHNPELPLSPGIGQMILGMAGIGLATVRWRSTRKNPQNPHPWPELLTIVAGIIALGTLFLSTSWSAALWQRIGPLQGLQFPWRFLDIPTFFLALVCCRLFYGSPEANLKEDQSPKGWVSRISGRISFSTAWMVVVLLFFFVNMVPYLYPSRVHDLPQQPTLTDVSNVQREFGILGLTAWGEYSSFTAPAWPSSPLSPSADTNIPLTDKLIDPPPGIFATSGDPWQATWKASLTESETITVASHYFPGWRAKVDGESTVIKVDENGRLQLTIPAGEHEVELAFRRTPLRWLADGATLISALMLAGLIITGARRNQAQKPAGQGYQHLASLGWTVVALFVLLTAKLLWLDKTDNWLVTHSINGRPTSTAQPPFGNFNDEIQLTGYQLSEPDHIELYWWTLTPPARPYSVRLMMIDARGGPVSTINNETPGYSLTTYWEPGLLTRDTYRLPVDSRNPPVGYLLYISLLDSLTGEPLPLIDAPWVTSVPVSRVKNPPPEANIPDDARPIGTIFGDSIKLSHTKIPPKAQHGESIQFTLYWEAINEINSDYTVFVHLLKLIGRFAAGQDLQPLDGLYPTSFWEPGEVITDGRTWLPEVPPGTYQVQVGLYQLETGQRLPVSGPLSQLGDRVILQTIEIGDDHP